MATGTGDVTASASAPLGAGYPGPFGPGEVTAPSSTELASGFTGWAGSASVTAPTVTVTTTTNQSGKVGVANIIPPVVRVRGQGLQDHVIVPSVTISSTGEIGFPGTGDVDAPDVTTAGSGLTGPIGTGSVLLPGADVRAGSRDYAEVDVSAPTVSAAGQNGRLGLAAVNGGRVVVSATLESTPLPGTQAGSITVSAPLVDGNGSQAAIISGAVTVAPTIQGIGVTGRVGSGSITVPSTTIIASLAGNNTGSVAITVPTAVVDAAGVAAVVTAVFEGLSVNTRLNAVTEYTGLSINSMAKFAGLDLAATDAGIVALTGITDSGTAIATRVRSGLTDINSTRVKKIPLAYVAINASSDITMSMAADNKTERSYTLQRKLTGLHGAKVKFGLGIVGRHWQWGFNSTGGTVAIREITFDVEDTKRRIT